MSNLKLVQSKAFTLIEILVVATIIALLAAIGAVSYTQINKSSRDARRKTDLEQIRAAVEMYRSNNNAYPSAAQITFTCPSSGSLTDASNTYLSKIPNDPKCSSSPAYTYFYTSPSASDYTVGAYLENTPSSGATCGTCFGSTACNYCLGPYGQK